MFLIAEEGRIPRSSTALCLQQPCGVCDPSYNQFLADRTNRGALLRGRSLWLFVRPRGWRFLHSLDEANIWRLASIGKILMALHVVTIPCREWYCCFCLRRPCGPIKQKSRPGGRLFALRKTVAVSVAALGIAGLAGLLEELARKGLLLAVLDRGRFLENSRFFHSRMIPSFSTMRLKRFMAFSRGSLSSTMICLIKITSLRSGHKL